jgi:hypothetical protein
MRMLIRDQTNVRREIEARWIRAIQPFTQVPLLYQAIATDGIWGTASPEDNQRLSFPSLLSFASWEDLPPHSHLKGIRSLPLLVPCIGEQWQLQQEVVRAGVRVPPGALGVVQSIERETGVIVLKIHENRAGMHQLRWTDLPFSGGVLPAIDLFLYQCQPAFICQLPHWP